MNISYTVKHDLCTGCGICVGACPTSSISIKSQNGLFIPAINETTCINNKGCNRCYDSCPGIGVNLKEIANDNFSEIATKEDIQVGKYLNCYSGYSTKYDIRYHSASGGMISQFLIFLLEKNYIDGAYVTAFDPSNELLVNSYIARTREDILRAKSSKYAPVTLNHAIQDIKSSEGKYVIVGLPCHIHGFRKYETIDKKFKEKILGYLGIYCSSGRSFYLTEYVFNKFGIDKNGLQYFAYRDEGCLGSLVAKGISSTTLKPFLIKERFQQYYHPLRSFFIPKRCTQCIDHFAELADVSFGDIHIDPYIQDKIGINSLVVRKQIFKDWLLQAKDEGYIILDSLDIDVLKRSQRVVFQKKNRSTTFLKIDKQLGKKIPIYDMYEKDPYPLKSVISYLHTMAQICVGKRKWLWFVIDIFKMNTKKLK